MAVKFVFMSYHEGSAVTYVLETLCRFEIRNDLDALQNRVTSVYYIECIDTLDKSKFTMTTALI